MVVVKKYWSNNNLKREIPYKEGLKHGLECEYNRLGVLIASVEYCEGLSDGYVTLYRENGTVEERTQYKNGIKQNNSFINDTFVDECMVLEKRHF